MKVLVIDAQGGGLGKALVEQLCRALPKQPLIALGTNALATAAMLKAGADMAATGENAIVFNCRDADVIIGPLGILSANAMLGEISPAIAQAVGSSPAQKILIPSQRCAIHVAGVRSQPLDALAQEAVQKAAQLLEGVAQ